MRRIKARFRRFENRPGTGAQANPRLRNKSARCRTRNRRAPYDCGMARATQFRGMYQCHFCDRVLSLLDFATDRYKSDRGKPPGKCRDCDREYGRARTAYSATGKLADCRNNAAAYFRAREICAAHAWGKHDYATRGGPDDPNQVIARHREEYERRYKPKEPTAAELREAEETMLAAAERKSAERHQELDAAARQRAAAGPVAEQSPAAPADDEATRARKEKLRAQRAARRRQDWEPAPFRA